MRLLIASANQGKVREFRELLGHLAIECDDLAISKDVPAPQETGHTFRANAMLKAVHYANASERWALADDSGLAIDALGGKPGVHSARWAAMHGAGEGDADNNALLLKQMSEVPDELRTARFVCVLALVDPQGRVVLTAEDSMEGVLLRAPRGAGGFGYDPLFMVPALGRTTAELDPAQKHAVSHRGKAMRRLAALMSNMKPFRDPSSIVR